MYTTLCDIIILFRKSLFHVATFQIIKRCSSKVFNLCKTDLSYLQQLLRWCGGEHTQHPILTPSVLLIGCSWFQVQFPLDMVGSRKAMDMTTLVLLDTSESLLLSSRNNVMRVQVNMHMYPPHPSFKTF